MLDEVEFDQGSVMDPAGKVFHYEGRVFRAISPEFETIYLEFLQADFLQNIFDAGLVKSWKSDLELEGFGLIVEHQKITTLSKWTEWSSSMIQDATAMVCRLNAALSQYGYITKDIQPGNVQFENGLPLWIDFGSIVPLKQSHNFCWTEFRCHSLFPLWLMSKKRFGLSRAIFGEVGIGYWKSQTSRRFIRAIPFKYRQLERKVLKDGIVTTLQNLQKYVETLTVEPKGGFWTDYGQGGMPPVDRPELFEEKAAAVYKLLQQIPPGSLLDVAANKGWHAELATSMGHSVTAFDLDDASICKLHKKIKEENLPILPLVMNFLYPTPAYSIGLGKADAFSRLRSDTVLVLALIHHLVFKQNIFFEPIIEIISSYTKKQAIIEFIPKDDQYVSEWFNPTYSWYTLDNFIGVLKRHFRKIDVEDSFPYPRKLLLCTK